MGKISFASGIVAGAAVSLALVISVPALNLSGKTASVARVSRPGPQVVEVPIAAPVPVAAPAAPATGASPGGSLAGHGATEAPKQPGQQPSQMEKEIEAARLAANEIVAIATLRNICSAQAQIQSCARADENQNGIGEFCAFAEMSGALGIRGDKVLNPPVLSSAFRAITHGRAERSGYYFQIYLPGSRGSGVSEREAGGFLAGDLDPVLAETAWCCYAWPVEWGVTGRRAFFMNQAGDVLSSVEARYSGDRGPAPEAAFQSTDITGETALGAVSCDRSEWKQAG